MQPQRSIDAEKGIYGDAHIPGACSRQRRMEPDKEMQAPTEQHTPMELVRHARPDGIHIPTFASSI